MIQSVIEDLLIEILLLSMILASIATIIEMSYLIMKKRIQRKIRMESALFKLSQMKSIT